MPAVRPCPVPQDSLLHAYQDRDGFADCYVAGMPGAVSQAAFIEAVYTSGLFKVERTLLQHLAARPATDADARLLAKGQAQQCSAWHGLAFHALLGFHCLYSHLLLQAASRRVRAT